MRGKALPALGAMALLAACEAKGGNPLIGRWAPVDADCVREVRLLEFTADTQVVTADDVITGAPRRSVGRVSYNTADPTEVSVIGASGIPVEFKLLGRDRIQHAGWPACVYRRAG